MAGNEVASAVEDCGRIRVLASYDEGRSTVFLVNYDPDSTEDLAMSVGFLNARVGRANMKVYRIDEGRRWDGDMLELIPTEDRTVYLHGDFHFDLFVPADSVVMVVFEY